jgi:hypothetical protein
MNNPNYDDRFLSYGFLIGIHTSTYQLKYSDRFVSKDLDSLYAISPSWSPGCSLGFIVNLHLSEFLDLRLLPKVSFYEHRIEYLRLDEPKIDELVETTVVEFPLLLKYKSERRGNFRMYMLGGVTPGFEASGKNDVDEISKKNLNIKAFNNLWGLQNSLLEEYGFASISIYFLAKESADLPSKSPEILKKFEKD